MLGMLIKEKVKAIGTREILKDYESSYPKKREPLR